MSLAARLLNYLLHLHLGVNVSYHYHCGPSRPSQYDRVILTQCILIVSPFPFAALKRYSHDIGESPERFREGLTAKSTVERIYLRGVYRADIEKCNGRSGRK